ncbi:NADPH:quinone oxidoreductase family protein [Mycolicibacterium sp. S2-37]|uniref:NADPH:quinone oxidoreductase family protein n=1 Tax=Mycolicibacterium sp. S2-37 TaxID=2810297 RepID=UPI001A93E072|nr:NADPH:quinone oxidoreductase family protein [Mycolicibacterium sp. S2-37]MBO0678008.1 NADPH:quinone oxidoreductase family protein [Mycolicibacterium sp. S2-37]
MRAAVCPVHGPPEVVEIRELTPPERSRGQLRVRVRAAAVNYPDVLLIGGRYQVSVPPPFVPGSEFAGEVVETDDAAGGFAIGDRVSGTGMYGAFAEEVVVEPAALSPVPAGVHDRAAAAFGVAHRTAFHALRSVARIRPGDELIVLGAGGGVGLAAVQLAVVLGARVTAVAASEEKLAVAGSYGAHRLVNRRHGALREALKSALPDGACAVLDPVGGGSSEPAMRSLRRGGRFVTVGYASGTIPRIPLNLVLVKGIVVQGFQFGDIPADEYRRNEAELRELLATGKVRPHIGATYALGDAVAALRQVADGHAVGKIVIDMA